MSRLISFVCLILVLLGIASDSSAQTLNLPARPANAPPGSAFMEMIDPLSFGSSARQLSPREVAICGQILQGNVPNWMRQMTLVTTNATINGTNHTISYYVIPDYLAVGAEEDYFLIPTTPLLAQRLADAMNCSLTTSKMVNDIWKKAPCKLSPSTIPPDPQMISVDYYNRHNNTVHGQRFAVTNSSPLGALTGGDKKDVIIANKIYSNFSTSITNVVVIYGWHQLNGVNIQPVYNGHEETYADYSHGLRMVQMNLTVDGQTNTVTNVLNNPNLAGLLSDDTIYPSNTIPKPRYTLAAMPPAITLHPISQTVSSNGAINFSTFAVGDKPLSYQWKCNGTNLAGATNAALSITNVQSANAGNYTVVASNTVGTATSIPALLKIQNPTHPILFADDFETDSSTNWNLFWGSGNGVVDYTVDWAFDYSRESYTFNGNGYFIPPAPNSGTSTHGVRLTVNNNDTNAAIAGLSLYPKNGNFSNDFALKFDLWMNYPGGIGGVGSSGSTEYATFGVNHLGTQANWAATSASSTDGLWFGVDGEGGVSADYRAFVGNLGGIQTELLGANSGLSESNSTANIFQTLFPAARHETAGAPGKNWVEVELRQSGGILTWLMDGTVVAQRPNSSAFKSGKIMIGFMDPFASIASPTNQAFVIFDNVRVEDLSQVVQSPVISSAPQNQQANVGANPSFSASVSGSSPLFYQWFLNNVAISGATNQTLQLTNVNLADSGDYKIVVSNSAGFASATATLTVLSSPAQFQSISLNGSGQAQLTFAGSSGISYLLEASTNLVSWMPISVLAISNGSLPFLDLDATNLSKRFYRSHSSTDYSLTDFESYPSGASVLFQRPSSSGSTLGFVDTNAGDFAYVTNVFPAGHGSTKVLAVNWSFKTGASNPWLRLNTFNTAILPNPIIGFNQAIQFDIYSDQEVYVTLAVRETNPTGAIGSDGGTSGSIEWIGGITANAIPPKGHFISAGQWTTVTIFIPQEPVRGFTGNGILETTSGKGVLEHLCFVPGSGLGAYNIYLDNFKVIDLTP